MYDKNAVGPSVEDKIIDFYDSSTSNHSLVKLEDAPSVTQESTHHNFFMEPDNRAFNQT
jgi:hypothetical protein